MISQRRLGIAAAALCAAAAVVPAGTPAHAAPAADTRPLGTLLLSVRLTEQPEQGVRTVILRCGADGGTHRFATKACDDLRSVDGNLESMIYDDGPCTLEYMPVTATAVGRWRGRPVSYQETFPNRCDMLRATGDVFRF